jgi:hypothetical protein
MDDEGRTPLDLPRLRSWIGHLTENYDALVSRGDIGYAQREIGRYRDALISIGRACDGEFKRPVKARIRELLALGAASYALPAGGPPAESLTGQQVIDFGVCCLWPLTTVPDLPATWLDSFLDITHSASLVVQARYRSRISEAMSLPEFGQAMTEVSYAPGIRNLLDELADPRGAGCALAAMAIARTRYAPRRGASQKRVAKWALLAAIGVTTPPSALPPEARRVARPASPAPPAPAPGTACWATTPSAPDPGSAPSPAPTGR